MKCSIRSDISRVIKLAVKDIWLDKHDILTPWIGIPSQVKLPLSKHSKSCKRYVDIASNVATIVQIDQ